MFYFRVSRLDDHAVGSLIWDREPKIGDNKRLLVNKYEDAFAQRDWDKISPNISDHLSQILEGALEFVRKNYHPELPCRFENMAVCEKLDGALFFRGKYRKDQGNTIYKIEYPDDEATFVGDMNMLDKFGGADPLTIKCCDLIGMAKDYWRGKTTSDSFREVILDKSRSAVMIENLGKGN